MKRRFLTGICTATMVLGLSSAQAADLAPPQAADLAPPPAPLVYDWTGFYVGGHLGYGWDDADISTSPLISFWGGISTKIDLDDWLGGVQLGYWWQTGNGFVFGVDASLSGTGMDDSNPSPVFPITDTVQAEIDLLLLIQGRLGWSNDAWLLFVQGGYGGVDASAGASTTIGPFSTSDSNWHNGWTIGIGANYRVSQNFSIGAEYNYIDTSGENYAWAGIGLDSTANIEHDMHVVKVTGNIHFNLFGGR